MELESSKSRVGVFITTHMEKGTRHAGNLDSIILDYYDYMLDSYQKYSSGIESLSVYIMDTNSTFPGFDELIKNKLKNPLYKKMDIINKGGFTASMKHLMHTDPAFANNFDYFLFHIDDGVEITGDNWASEIIEEYNSHKTLGIMGRYVDSIRLGPTGLVDHRNCCSHIARIWGITEVTTIPHLHGDWWFMNRETLRGLGQVWFHPVKSIPDMQYFQDLENIPYPELVHLQLSQKGSQVFDDMHIGREVDTSLRVSLINKQLATYTGSKIYAKQLHHRNRSNFRV